MNFTHLKAFFTVAKLKSFTKAAVELSVSQPTLSLQVQSLENQYDIVLINRTKKSIELTEEGKTVYSFADTIFSLSREGFSPVIPACFKASTPNEAAS